MKIRQITLLPVLVLGYTLCFGQTDHTKTELGSIQQKTKQDSILYVLKVDDKYLEFDTRKNENLDFKIVDFNSIESMYMLKGIEAKEKYGDKAQDGVIIIIFKDFNLLSEELQRMFNDSPKN